MTNRVLLDTAHGLRISKPGDDVMTTAERDLWFNSAWSQGNVFLRATFTSFTGTGLPISYTFNFGRTLPNNPIVTTLLQFSGLSYFIIGATESSLYSVRPSNTNLVIIKRTNVNMTMRFCVWDYAP